MEDIMKIFDSLKESRLLIQGFSETIKNETKEQKGGLISMLLRTFAASLLRTALTGKRVTIVGQGTIRASKNF